MNSCSLHKLSYPEERCPSCVEDVTNEITLGIIIKRIHRFKNLSVISSDNLATIVFTTAKASTEQIIFINAVRLLHFYKTNTLAFKDLLRGRG